MNNRIRLGQTRYQKGGHIVKDFATGTGNTIEKALIVGGGLLGGYNHYDIIGKFEKIFGSSERLNDYPKTGVVVTTIGCAILGNLIAKGAIKGSKAGYNYLTSKRNVISRAGVTNPTARSTATSGISEDTLIEREIVDAKIRNLEEARGTITGIINKIKTVESDLKDIEHTIDTHINKDTPDNKNEVIAHYGGTDASADIIDINDLAKHNQYFTTKPLSEKLLNAKNKKEITDKYLPRIQYDYEASSDEFVSSGKYLIGSTEIGGRLRTLDTLQQQLELQINTLSNTGRSSTASLRVLESLQTKLNAGDIPKLGNDIIAHIEALGLSDVKEKNRPTEETLIEETHGLKKSFKNSQDQSKTLLQKLGKKVGL